jgi:TRAP transporter TAXI family solute receptor
MARIRGTALALVVVAMCGLLSACSPDFTGLHLRIAAGSRGGVYYQLAQPLASAWAEQLNIEQPEVKVTRGSPDNLQQLKDGNADVAFSAADVAANSAAQPAGRPKLVALARIYDDYLHVVVRKDSPITAVSMLRGRKVAIGSPESGVEVIAKQLLTVALGTPDAVDSRNLGLQDALDALSRNDIDAVFWSGGLPTDAISKLNATVPLRLLDVADVLPAMLRANEVYRTATIPASTYQLTDEKPVTTLVVPNFLVVSSAMPDDEAEALVRGLFKAQPELVKANAAALSIDVRPAIETAPLELHPGALRYYRSIKT